MSGGDNVQALHQGDAGFDHGGELTGKGSDINGFYGLLSRFKKWLSLTFQAQRSKAASP